MLWMRCLLKWQNQNQEIHDCRTEGLTMEKYIIDEHTGLKYELVGDYYIIAGYAPLNRQNGGITRSGFPRPAG